MQAGSCETKAQAQAAKKVTKFVLKRTVSNARQSDAAAAAYVCKSKSSPALGQGQGQGPIGFRLGIHQNLVLTRSL